MFLRLLICAFLILFCLQYSYAKSNDIPKILVIGDSLSAGFGIDPSKGWVSLLQNRLQNLKMKVVVINASISGDTTLGAMSRFEKTFAIHRPRIVIIEIGGNDGLRGLPLASMQKNISVMIKRSLEMKSQVLLLGMRLPPNYGIQYTKRFFSIYGSLAKQYKVNIVPFFLQGVASNPELMQSDGIHPREQAQTILLENVWEKLLPMLNTGD